jgi:ABC-2 type transport system permease protein
MWANWNAFAASVTLQMRQSFSRSMFRFCMIAYPLLYGFLLYMLYKDQSGVEVMAYVMLGTAVSSLWGTISFSSAGDINRERFMGALEIIFNAPVPFAIIMFGKVVGNTILGLVSMAISIIFIWLAFGIPFTLANPLLFVLVVLIGSISFAAVGMMLSGLLAISRSTRVLMNCIDYPIMILCGVAFPISILPLWTRPLSYILSPTHFLVLSRMCVQGVTDMALFQHHFVWMVGLTLVYGGFALHFYKVIDIYARRHATLEVV